MGGGRRGRSLWDRFLNGPSLTPGEEAFYKEAFGRRSGEGASPKGRGSPARYALGMVATLGAVLLVATVAGGRDAAFPLILIAVCLVGLAASSRG